MKTKKFLTMAVCALAICGAASSALAAPTDNDPGKNFGPKHHYRVIKHRRFYRMKKAFRRLTPEQRATIKKMHQELVQHTRNMRNQLRINNLLLKAEILKTKPDQVKIDKLTNQIGKIGTELLKKRVDFVLKVKNSTGIQLPLRPSFHR